jgi:hypothetical protein
MPARVVSFPTESLIMVTLKHALVVAAVIAAVMLVNNMTGNKLGTALAA